MPRFMLHAQGIKLELLVLGVTQPTAPCHVAWPGKID
jgi:hypothetical protein